MVNFENGVTPINDTNLNKMQTDLQKAITDLKGTVLYEDSIGTTGDITLSESAANFKKLEVQYSYNNLYCSTGIIENPNGKKMSLSVGFSVTQYKVARYQYKVIAINETSITTDTAGYISCSEANATDVSSTENKIYITKVIGYKEA